VVATGDEGVEIKGIYVLPSEPGMPPRALLLTTDEDPKPGDVLEGVVAVFSSDMGCWTAEGDPLPSVLGEAVTAHAASLGVPGFTPTEQ
jgi:hypothetical protein